MTQDGARLAVGQVAVSLVFDRKASTIEVLAPIPLQRARADTFNVLILTVYSAIRCRPLARARLVVALLDCDEVVGCQRDIDRLCNPIQLQYAIDIALEFEIALDRSASLPSHLTAQS